MRKPLLTLLVIVCCAGNSWAQSKPLVVDSITDSERERAMLTASYLNKQLPDFTYTDMQGNPVSRSSLRGKVLVLNFWFIECKPCQLEIPELNELVQKFRNNPDVVFLGVAMNAREKLGEFLKKKPFHYQVIPEAAAFANALAVSSYPTHLVVDQNGKIQAAQIGYESGIVNKLAQNIETLLKK